MATANDTAGAPTNAIRGLLAALKPDGCYCDDEFQRGRDLVAVMAVHSDPKEESSVRLSLGVRDCADVLAFLTCTEARLRADIPWGGYPADSHEYDTLLERYGGDPSFGLYTVLRHVQNELARNLSRQGPETAKQATP